MAKNNIIVLEDIKYKIYTIRDSQVMIDSDLAELYNVSTKRLNEQVKRNKDRFPKDFCFQLTENELYILRSQIATTNVDWAKKRVLPFAFTEQGVASLSGILKSKQAIEMNILIMRTFVSMRKFISKNADIFNRLDSVERKQLDCQLETNKNFKKVFDAIENKDIIKKQGIFYDGQVFDAHKFISDIIRSAQKSIILVDNYIDDSVLMLFTKARKNIVIKIYTENITPNLELDLKKYNLQYKSNPIEIKKFKKSHDRFLIIDKKDVYHMGASIKDLGKKWFAFAKLDSENKITLNKLK